MIQPDNELSIYRTVRSIAPVPPEAWGGDRPYSVTVGRNAA